MNEIREEDRSRALSLAVQTLEKRFGPGAVMRMGDRQQVAVEVVPTGCLALDQALGTGGLPRGRVVEVYGPEASGKTTLALHAIAQVQATGGTAAFVDAEHALDVTYARKLGVDVDSLLVAQPDSGEQALEISETLVRSGAVDLVVVDSVAALVPQAEIEGQMGDTHVGLQARLMSQALRKLTAIANRTRTMLLFINQVRHKIGVTFGNGEVTTGGNALKFYASVRLEIRRIGSINDADGAVIGNRTRVKVVKNKLSPPFRKIEVDIVYGRGICPAGDVLELAEQHGLVSRAGSWYTLGEERVHGREKLRDKLLDDRELLSGLTSQVRDKIFPPPIAEAK